MARHKQRNLPVKCSISFPGPAHLVVQPGVDGHGGVDAGPFVRHRENCRHVRQLTQRSQRQANVHHLVSRGCDVGSERLAKRRMVRDAIFARRLVTNVNEVWE